MKTNKKKCGGGEETSYLSHPQDDSLNVIETLAPYSERADSQGLVGQNKEDHGVSW